MNLINRALALREGGQTQRCHTIQYTGPYNVAIHSYNALSLLLLLYPGNPRIELIRAVMFHDTPERWTGDVPTPTKMSSPELRKAIDELEKKVLEKLGLGNLFTDLTPREEDWLHAVDLLELFMWGKDQEAMGNSSVQRMNELIYKLFYDRKDEIPGTIFQFLKDFKWQRSIECQELINDAKESK